MKKKEIAKLKQGDPVVYVVRHGEWRLRRGKRPSAILPAPYGIRNPEKAFRAAKSILERSTRKRPLFIFNGRGQTRLEEFLNVPPPHEAPWPGARRVPHTGNWY